MHPLQGRPEDCQTLPAPAQLNAYHFAITGRLLLLATGYAEDGYTAHREFPLLQKPFATLELTQAIEALLRRKASLAACLCSA